MNEEEYNQELNALIEQIRCPFCEAGVIELGGIVPDVCSYGICSNDHMFVLGGVDD